MIAPAYGLLRSGWLALRRAASVLRHGAAHLQALQEAQQQQARELQAQSAFNQHLDEALAAARANVAEARAAIAARTAEVQAAMAARMAEDRHSLEAAMQLDRTTASSRLNALEDLQAAQARMLSQQLPAHEAHLQGLQAHAEALTLHEQALQAQAEALTHHVQALQAEAERIQRRLGLNRPQLDPLQREAFYLQLEAEFRGSPEDVQRRQSVYRHWIDQAPPGRVVDLGCGRGEWLALLSGWGRPAQGVDANGLNAAEGRSRGLQIEQADALEWLTTQPSESVAALTAFHLAEHLPFDDLHLVVLHAQRVLVPGGVLVLETPNPENFDVATLTFWLDPTHRRPLPAGLMSVLVRACGLQVLTVLRLNAPEEDPGPVSGERLLQSLIQGRDCAIVARKPGPAEA